MTHSRAYLITRSIVRGVLFTGLILAPFYVAGLITNLLISITP